MNARLLARRSLLHYRRTNVAVVLGVACAVAVLAGALLVGSSVRASLRAISSARLGNTDVVVTSETFFNDRVIEGDRPPAIRQLWPVPKLIVLPGSVTHEASGRRASQVTVYGIDYSFFPFHGLDRDGSKSILPLLPSNAHAPPSDNALLSASLARELGAAVGDSLVIRVARPSDIPLESLHGRRDESGRALRARDAGVLAPGEMGDFALSPSQGPSRSVFVHLSRLQQDLDIGPRANALLLAKGEGATLADVQDAVRRAMTPEDIGLHVRMLDNGAVSVESDAGLITDALAEDVKAAAARADLSLGPVFTYLANEMTAGNRHVPYSLIAAMDPGSLPASALRAGLEASVENPIVLNDWAARDLGVKPGDAIEVAYYRWLDAGRLVTERASFTLAAVTPIEGIAADRRLSPDYPGISDTDSLSDWDPPFPVDLSLVRPIDEDYWDRYRTTPKAFIPVSAARRLWGSRWGSVTSLRVAGGHGTADEQRTRLVSELRARIDPTRHGLRIVDVRAESADAAQGSADFGLYFLGFSYFLVVSALLLAGLFFRFGVEQRLREIGLLTAVGFTRRAIRRIFLIEGLSLAIAGSLAGAAGALGYAAIVIHGLRTWWQGAVNTPEIELHVTPAPLVIGAAAGIITAWLCIALSIRGLRALSPRSLLAGHSIDALAGTAQSGPRARIVTLVSAAGAVLLSALGFLKVIPDAGAFFGGGMLLLVALLSVYNLLLRRRRRRPFAGAGGPALARFGLRNASWRPGRSVLSASLVAAAVFLIVAVDAFRRGGDEPRDPKAGAGGFALVGESSVPIVHDLNTPQGREDAGLILDDAIASTLTFYQMRLRPGDDTSCVNLYKPKRPRIAGVGEAFIQANRFAFAASLAESASQKANPWTLLMGDAEPFPAIADATSLQYVLHAAVGDELIIDEDSSRPLRIRIVGALRDSALQGEIMVGDAAFKTMFPDEAGFRMLLVDVGGDSARARLDDIAGQLEGGLDQSGLDVQLTSDRLAAYHRVENTYLSTFQALGALGLLLGTAGLATVLARNVLERRRELALLRAVGYGQAQVSRLVLSEHLMLLAAGMIAGALAALVAILPALIDRGMPGGWTLPAWLAGIFAVGALATILAGRVALDRPLVAELRSE